VTIESKDTLPSLLKASSMMGRLIIFKARKKWIKTNAREARRSNGGPF